MPVPPGVTFLDHTADVGLLVDATSLEALYHRAGLGMLALLRGEDDAREPDPPSNPAAPAGAEGERLEPGARPSSQVAVELDADTPAALLADWLRELLFLHDAAHRDYVDADFERLDASALRARVRTEPAPRAVREIKGVTYHELGIEETPAGWRAQVIFDV